MVELGCRETREITLRTSNISQGRVTFQYRSDTVSLPLINFLLRSRTSSARFVFCVRTPQKFNIDPDQIGAIGYSAGAHLSMMLGTMDKEDGFEGTGGWPEESSKVQAVVSYFGPTQLDAKDIPKVSLPLVSTFIGGSAKDKPVVYRQASPLTYVTVGDAPMLLFQGTNDPLVPHSQAIKMVAAMTRKHVPGRVELLINADHGNNWGAEERERTKQTTLAFFKKHLK